MKKTKKTNKPKEPKEPERFYCRKCMKNLAPYNFYEATNLNLDTNGKMSVCKKCCNDLYDLYLSIYNNMEIALDATCRDLDVRFSRGAVSQTKSHINSLINRGSEARPVFGYYKSKVSSPAFSGKTSESLMYKDSDELSSEVEKKTKMAYVEAVGNVNYDELILFWGPGFSHEELIDLESEMANWKKTHKCDNRAETILFKEICIKILDIKKKRVVKEPVSADLKELQELFKTASVDPSKANVASAGKSQEAWGAWIKDIEQLRPAEWHDKQKKYRDMDGFINYIKNYIYRPVKNFITAKRDFNINDNININLSDDS